MGILRAIREQRGRRLARALPAWQPTEDSQCGHVVQFYGGAFPVDAVATFLREGLAAGEVGIMVATPKHTMAVQTKLGGSGRCIFLDAEETMARFMVDGRPDRTRFMDTVGDIVAQAAQMGNGRVRAFGEMVVLLCRKGEPEAAHELEQLWNELGAKHSLKLLCSYPLTAFVGRTKSYETKLRDTHAYAVLS
ncbi:MAG TPA: MEDS domain-containing protein [Candidatus Thermoplasmatota archaeon]|nr:MEDS domain-containing protein [Candidatus Thermoplasmatota archaeon]